ncbi:hypothetical protein MRX96_045196 [Rhipicephalus microplus]
MRLSRYIREGYSFAFACTTNAWSQNFPAVSESSLGKQSSLPCENHEMHAAESHRAEHFFFFFATTRNDSSHSTVMWTSRWSHMNHGMREVKLEGVIESLCLLKVLYFP